MIKVLIRQSSRWATAAKQDQNPLICVLHANYGAGYLWALKDIATDEQIYGATGVDSQKFTQEIVNVQDSVTQRLAKLCPDFAPDQDYLAKIAGEA